MATLAEQMVTDISTVFLNTTEHAVTRYAIKTSGEKVSMSMIVENHRSVLMQYDGGTKKMLKATLGVAESSGADEYWSFDVDNDGRYWVFDREGGGIENDQCGWLWVPVTIATQEEAASMEYRRR